MGSSRNNYIDNVNRDMVIRQDAHRLLSKVEQLQSEVYDLKKRISQLEKELSEKNGEDL